jgi:Flp pilus assembly pilin Flp
MDLFVLKSWLQAKFASDDRGANLVEYILLVALIALAVIAAVVFLRGQLSSKFDQTGSTLSTSS